MCFAIQVLYSQLTRSFVPQYNSSLEVNTHPPDKGIKHTRSNAIYVLHVAREITSICESNIMIYYDQHTYLLKAILKSLFRAFLPNTKPLFFLCFTCEM